MVFIFTLFVNFVPLFLTVFPLTVNLEWQCVEKDGLATPCGRPGAIFSREPCGSVGWWQVLSYARAVHLASAWEPTEPDLEWHYMYEWQCMHTSCEVRTLSYARARTRHWPWQQLFWSSKKCGYYTDEQFKLNVLLNHGLSIVLINNRSLHNNFQNIKDYFDQSSNPFSIIAISETWVHELTGYQLHMEKKKVLVSCVYRTP